MILALCHPSSNYSFEATPRFLKNMYSPGLTPSNCCSSMKADNESRFRLLEKLR